MRTTFSVLKNHNFAKYFTAQFLSAIGNGMQFIAMSWLIYKQTGSVASMGWFLVLTALPGIFLSPWIGVLVDRWNVKKICIAMDCVRGAVLLGFAALIYAGPVPTALIYVSEFIIVCCNLFYQPSAGVLVRSVVPPERLLSANVVRSMGVQIGVLLGAAIGGMLIAHFGASLVILINVMSFFLSAALTLTIARNDKMVLQRAKTAGAGMVADFVAGVRYMRAHPYLISLAMMLASIFMTLYVCNTLLPAFATKVLAVGAEGFGLIDSAWAAGAIVSGPLLSYIVKRFQPRQFTAISLVMLAGAIGIFLSAQGLVQAMLGYFLIGFLTASIRVNADTVIQMNVDPAFLGRVTTTISMFISCLSLVVYVSVGYLGDMISIRWIYLAIALLILAVAAAPALFSRIGKDDNAVVLPGAPPEAQI